MEKDFDFDIHINSSVGNDAEGVTVFLHLTPRSRWLGVAGDGAMLQTHPEFSFHTF
jgi:hypothetical protein